MDRARLAVASRARAGSSPTPPRTEVDARRAAEAASLTDDSDLRDVDEIADDVPAVEIDRDVERREELIRWAGEGDTADGHGDDAGEVLER